MRVGKILTCSDKEFIEIVKTSYSYSECIRKLGYTKVHGGSYRGLKNRIEKLNIDTSHMKPNHNSALKTRFHNDEIFCENSSYKGRVRVRVLKENLIPYVCALCGIGGVWQGKELTLTLDHINGDHTDNRLKNLRFLCPNCDSQQETYCGKNKRKYYKNN